MAKKPAAAKPVPAATTHHGMMGQAAHAAMKHLGSSGMQSASANPLDFGTVQSQHEDWTPRAYVAKPNPKG